VGASVDALGVLLAAGGLLTTSNSRSLFYLLILRLNPVLGIAIPFLNYKILFSYNIARVKYIEKKNA